MASGFPAASLMGSPAQCPLISSDAAPGWAGPTHPLREGCLRFCGLGTRTADTPQSWPLCVSGRKSVFPAVVLAQPEGQWPVLLGQCAFAGYKLVAAVGPCGTRRPACGRRRLRSVLGGQQGRAGPGRCERTRSAPLGLTVRDTRWAGPGLRGAWGGLAVVDRALFFLADRMPQLRPSAAAARGRRPVRVRDQRLPAVL